MSDSGGTVRTLWVFDASQGVQAATAVRASLQGIQQAGATGARSLDQLRNSEINAARAAGENARALQLIQRELLVTSEGTVRYNQLLAQQSRAQQALARDAAAAQKAAAQKFVNGQPVLPRTLESFGSEAIDQFKSGLAGIVGPAALAAAGIAVLTSTVHSFEDALKFKAELDNTNASIALSLKGVRDSGQTFAEAAAFADKYKLTQEETSKAIQASIPILRTSNASLTDVESTLLRLQAKKPEKSIADAARALDELKAGQIISIVDQFNVSRDAANKMKNEIAAGGDAIKILSDYLTGAGFGMESLALRTQGVTGALNDAKVAQEQLTIAQGKVAESAGGIFFVEGLARQYRGLANLLNGDALAGLQATGQEISISAQGALAYATAIASGKSAVEAQAAANQAATAATNALTGASGGGGTWGLVDAVNASTTALTEDAKKKLDSEIAAAGLAEQQKQLDKDSQLAAQGLLGAGDQALILAQKYGIAADQAQFLIDKQRGVSQAIGALIDLQNANTQVLAGNLSALSPAFAGENNNSVEGVVALQEQMKKEADTAAKEAERLADLQFQNRLINAKNNAEKIKILNERLAKTTDPIERQQLQNQIDQARLTTARGLTSEGGKRLKIEESIYDVINKQKDAALDLEESQIRGRQEARKAAQEDATAQNLLRALGSRTDARAQDFRGRAEDVIALNDVQRRRRAQQELEKQATVNGTIVSGRLLQSQPGTGNTPQGGAPVAPVAPAVAAPTSTNAIILVLQDSAGAVLAKSVEPIIFDNLIKATRAVKLTAGA